ncbi:hypothetical protein BKA67DRAFT_302481 [Truncatella angustata]|uniref:DUF6594 domain-containing protein n=1 Tax=Truncatella angustata TaxID=152316 RepID=A0A9P8ZXC0_9PEZI|nr:uncharacterized protein BKA67DRAFT_302481 [Truncatella angustata]KAH6652849.1 hypothetical protein BKA67DRAFT_302481 [Truncatella angustata]
MYARFQSWCCWLFHSKPRHDPEMGRIEEYNLGYPRFTALLSAHKSWFIFRRFDKLRARILLATQDRLSFLEQQLEEIDRQETSLLFLGRSRCDGNTDRLSTLSEISTTLADYGKRVVRKL